MNFYPAIDLKSGQCVRLLRGNMAQATVFSGDPGGQAGIFAAAGCPWLHVVDLDGAFAGQPVNAGAIDSIIEAVAPRGMKIQLGGGIRDLAAIDLWLAKGVDRVILGTVALTDPSLVKKACRLYPGKIAVGVDAKDGLAATNGWAKVSRVKAHELASRFEDAGAAAIIYTDIGRDGAMEGPNVEAIKAMAQAVALPVIASGGVSSMDDLARLKKAAPMIEGVICGRAIYDGRVDPAAAVKLLAVPC